MIDIEDIVAITIFILIIIAIFISDCGSIDQYQDQSEGFNVDKIELDDASLMKLHRKNENLLLSRNRYITVNDYNLMIMNIRQIIMDGIINQVRQCDDIGGSGYDKTISSQLTFNCIHDLESVQNDLINQIVLYIEKFIKDKYKLNTNRLSIAIDFKNNFDFLENILYPLAFTNKYTMQGMNYFTMPMLRDKVFNNTELENGLYTSLTRRGIDVLPIND